MCRYHKDFLVFFTTITFCVVNSTLEVLISAIDVEVVPTPHVNLLISVPHVWEYGTDLLLVLVVYRKKATLTSLMWPFFCNPPKTGGLYKKILLKVSFVHKKPLNSRIVY